MLHLSFCKLGREGCNVGNTLLWLYVSRDCISFGHDLKWRCCGCYCLREYFTADIHATSRTNLNTHHLSFSVDRKFILLAFIMCIT